MKNHALVTSLAVLLAVSLSAIVALVGGDLIGPRQQIAGDTPAAIVVDVTGPGTDRQPAPTEPGDVPAPSADDQAAAPGTDTATPDNDTPDNDPPGTATPDNDTPDNDTPDNDTPDLGDPPCAGTIVDGNCIPPISILCTLGYELVGDSCVYVGCPLGYQFVDGVCTQLLEGIPCPAGTIRNDAGDCEPLVVLDPTIVQPDFCIDGYAFVDGACVALCPEGSQTVGDLCLPDLTLKPGLLIPDLDLVSLANG